MKAKNFINCFIIGVFLFTFVAGCAGTHHKESTGEYVDDSVITTKVKAQIFDDPMLKVLQITVETFKGEVQLSGFVNSATASARAVEVAKKVKGVKSVKNSLIVKK
ncbi:BON domain-containing protein [Desulfobacula sp.]|uniref:BON domain-containing protein n=1 Tax=Desulfobacula sp. TaxID=2593537 RepID=UPI0026159F74|nr:BON domain-containing protein [Desulfobacula sp.]